MDEFDELAGHPDLDALKDELKRVEEYVRSAKPTKGIDTIAHSLGFSSVVPEDYHHMVKPGEEITYAYKGMVTEVNEESISALGFDLEGKCVRMEIPKVDLPHQELYADQLVKLLVVKPEGSSEEHETSRIDLEKYPIIQLDREAYERFMERTKPSEE